MDIYRPVFSLIFCFVCAHLLFAGSRKPKDYTPQQLKSAEDTLLIQNTKLVLDTYLWRDFMPQSPPDGKPLRAAINVIPVVNQFIPDGVHADKFWILNEEEVWSGPLKSVREDLPAQNRVKLEKVAQGGPKWGPGISVTVVIQIIDQDGKSYLLKTSNQQIHRTD